MGTDFAVCGFVGGGAGEDDVGVGAVEFCGAGKVDGGSGGREEGLDVVKEVVEFMDFGVECRWWCGGV